MATPVYASMVPLAGDTLQVLLVKAGYYTQVTAEALGAPFNSGMYASMSPNAQDTIHVLAAKLAYWTEQVAAGGGGGGVTVNPVYTGAAPPAAPALPLQGALFTPDADGAPLQKWIPGTGWVVV